MMRCICHKKRRSLYHLISNDSCPTDGREHQRHNKGDYPSNNIIKIFYNIFKKNNKSPIYDPLPQKTKEAISIQDFKEKCDQAIKAYQDFNKQKRQEKDDVNYKTVRELQEEILEFVHGKISIKDL